MGAMGTVARKPESTESPRTTYQDVLDAPAHRVAEIVDGTQYTHPRPAMPHASASSLLGVKIGAPRSMAPSATAPAGGLARTFDARREGEPAFLSDVPQIDRRTELRTAFGQGSGLGD